MSRYLEEAAEVLRKAEQGTSVHDRRMDVAKGFATLAAIDKGLLPAEIIQDILRTLTDHTTA